MIKIIQRVVLVLTLLAAALMIAAVLKTVGFSDTDGPEITMDESSITVDVDCTDEELLQGITAVDKKDGDVTDSLVVESLSNFIEKGRRQVTVAAFDQDHNVTKATREVVYDNYTSPRFSLSGPLRFAANSDEIMTAVFQVQDCLDGDLSDEVVLTSDYYYDYSVPGTYTVTFQVSNSAGDVVELPLTMEIYDASKDSSAPKVELSDYLIYVGTGSTVNPEDYIVGVTDNGMSWGMGDRGNPYDLSDIEITNPVDTATPGVYEISYTIPSDEEYQAVIRLVVIVE